MAGGCRRVKKLTQIITSQRGGHYHPRGGDELSLSRFIPLERAIELLSRRMDFELSEESVDLANAVGRIAVEDIDAPIDVPPFDRSAVDGYAVRAEDTYGASPTSPVELKLARSQPLERGKAITVHTGDRLPLGANAVVMKEFVEEREDRVLIYTSVPAYANVSRRGEDFRRGDRVLHRGEIIKPWHIAALASMGITRLRVFERIRASIIAIGSELVEPSIGPSAYDRGLVLSSTPYLIATELSRLGFFEPRYMGIVPDDVNEIRRRIEEALKWSHIVITTGGTGPGSRDLTARAVESLGEVVVRGIAIRPGRPTSAAVVDGKPVYMLSGLPVASFIALRFFVIPSLCRRLGISFEWQKVVARLGRRVANVVGYRSFVRVKLLRDPEKPEIVAEPLAARGSGLISTLIRANGILEIPENVEGFEEGESVEVYLL